MVSMECQSGTMVVCITVTPSIISILHQVHRRITTKYLGQTEKPVHLYYYVCVIIEATALQAHHGLGKTLSDYISSTPIRDYSKCDTDSECVCVVITLI